MLVTLLVTLALLALAVALLSVRLFFGKRFVNQHIDGSRAMQQRGIHCARRQDSEMRARSPFAVSAHTDRHKRRNHTRN